MNIARMLNILTMLLLLAGCSEGCNQALDAVGTAGLSDSSTALAKERAIVKIVNQAGTAVRVWHDGSYRLTLEAGGSGSFPATVGNHRLVVVDPGGRELVSESYWLDASGTVRDVF